MFSTHIIIELESIFSFFILHNKISLLKYHIISNKDLLTNVYKIINIWMLQQLFIP